MYRLWILRAGLWTAAASLRANCRFILIFYQSRDDISAVVHTHSVHATTLACLGLELPAVHYLIGFAGSSVRCAPYATFGTDELARNALDYMEGRKAVLLANHGLIAGGATIQEAFHDCRIS